MGFLGKVLPYATGGLIGGSLLNKKPAPPQGTLVNQYGPNGGRPTSLINTPMLK